MIQVLCLLLPPTIAMLLCALREREKKPAMVFITEWLVCAVALYVGTALIFLPLDRVAPRIGWNGRGGAFLFIEYGSAAMLALFALSILAGLFGPMIRRKLHISWNQTETREKKRMTAYRAAIYLLVLLALILTYTYIWGLANYGNVGVEEIIFHLRMPLAGTAGTLIDNYLRYGLFPALIAFAVFMALVFFPAGRTPALTAGREGKFSIRLFPLRMSARAAAFGLALWFAGLILSANQSFGGIDYIVSQMKQSQLFEEEYVDPQTVRMVFPEKKRNLITIYMESAETTAQDRANGGIFDVNYIPEMTRIARENVSFSHSDLLEGAVVAPACGWTIAGLVAETAGLPLKLYTQDDGADGIDNNMSLYEAFLPGATMLGDILKAEGYRLAFMCGSNLTFGGRRSMFAQHGGYEVYDHPEAKRRGVIEQDYKVFWGFEDEKLYAWAKDVLTELAVSDEPFHFSMLTVDTHSPDGYLCALCPDTYPEKYANVLACSSAQVDAFISWCEQQPFYENTTIVISGDHASMAPGFYDVEADKYNGTLGRKVYNAYINSAVEPVQEENRRFTTLDFFPTTLASIGVQIEGERLALGTNLFSDRETLSEQYGYEELFKQLNYKSLFYNNNILFP